jgi:hypothetical protein
MKLLVECIKIFQVAESQRKIFSFSIILYFFLKINTAHLGTPVYYQTPWPVYHYNRRKRHGGDGLTGSVEK